MRILIIGGLGYIGSSVAAELNARGHELVLVGRKRTDRASMFGEVHIWDATKEWEGGTPHFHIVVHLASSNGDYSLDSLEAYLGNLAATRNILKLCQQIPNSAILYVSTLQVYGRWTGELSDKIAASPASDYGLCHWVAEEHVKMFARVHKRRSLIIRPANIIGTGVDEAVIRWSTVPADFCLQAVTHRFINVRSSGKQFRDFIPVLEASRQIGDLIESVENWNGRTKLIASGDSISVSSVAEAVAQRARDLMDAPILVKYADESHSSSNESKLRVICDGPAIQQLTGFNPAEGLVESIDDLLKAALRRNGNL